MKGGYWSVLYLWLSLHFPPRTAVISLVAPVVVFRQTRERFVPARASVAPSVWPACPREPELSSAELQLCLAFFSSCTVRGCPYTEQEFACLSSDEVHRIQSPETECINGF